MNAQQLAHYFEAALYSLCQTLNEATDSDVERELFILKDHIIALELNLQAIATVDNALLEAYAQQLTELMQQAEHYAPNRHLANWKLNQLPKALEELA